MNVHCFSQTAPLQPKPCCFLPLTWILCRTQHQPSIQEKVMEGSNTFSLHSSNFVQDWISNLCFFFPNTSFSRRQLHSLKWLITCFCWKFYFFAFFPCLLPSDTGQIFRWQARLHSGFPGLPFGFWAPMLHHDSCSEPYPSFTLTSMHCQNLWFTHSKFPCPLKSLIMCWNIQFASVSLFRDNQFSRFQMRSFISSPCPPCRHMGQISSKLRTVCVWSYMHFRDLLSLDEPSWPAEIVGRKDKATRVRIRTLVVSTINRLSLSWY